VPAKNDVFFSAASYKKDIIFGGHLFSFSAVRILLGLYALLNADKLWLTTATFLSLKACILIIMYLSSLNA
jgi:hypothetical protein